MHFSFTSLTRRSFATARRWAMSGVFVAACATMSAPAWAAPVSVSSPDGSVKAQVTDQGGTLRYSVSLDSQQVLAPSEIGLRSDGVSYGQDASLGESTVRDVNETYPFLGAKPQAVNRARVATIPVTTNTEKYELDLHVADDGIGLRLRLPAKAGRKVEADFSTWKLPGDPTLWAAAPYDPAYEQLYRTTTFAKLTNKDICLPLTAKVGGSYVTITEAALEDYGDLVVKALDGGTLAGHLPNDPQGWTTDREVLQPWRVTIVARDLTALVNTTLVQNLNPPVDPSLRNVDWIHPGRSTWQWLAIGAPRFDDQHQWVDWTKDLGYEYYLVDEGWEHWPDHWAALKSVCDYAKHQDVKVWLWVHSNQVKDPQAREAYFKQAADTGVVGVKVDFPAPTNRWWSNWYHDTARDAAAHRLLIDFHGATKPTGMERTWPNELSREGVRGHEWQMTRYRRLLEPPHDTILPFTRFVVGHGDYTPTVFEPKELQGNTWAHELAQAIVFTSPFLCMGGHPKDYLANPAKDVVSALPAVWDETLVLPGSEPGRIAAMARRHGDQWFVGVMSGAEAAELQISLRFLSAGDWKATLLGDVPGKGDAWDRKEQTVNSATSWQTSLSTQGGFVAWIRK